MAILLGICTVLVIILLSGMAQQERIRLWHEYQDVLSRKRLVAIEKNKKEATSRVRDMLRQRQEEVAAKAAAGHDDPSAEQAMLSVESPEGGTSQPVAPLSAN